MQEGSRKGSCCCAPGESTIAPPTSFCGSQVRRRSRLTRTPPHSFKHHTHTHHVHTGTLESLPDTDLLALHARYGAGAAADVRLPSTARPLPSSSFAATAATAAAALPNEERTRLVAAIRNKLCPFGYIGLSCRAQRAYDSPSL